MTNLRKYQISYQKCCRIFKKVLNKSSFIAILFLMFSCFALAQTTKQNIKLEFSNASIAKVIESIEKQSGYSFFIIMISMSIRKRQYRLLRMTLTEL